MVPPGSYMIVGKALIEAESEAADFATIGCGLLANPGVTPDPEPENDEELDIAPWEAGLGQKAATAFGALTSLPLDGELKTSLTSTITIACENTSDSGVAATAPFARIFAIQVGSIG